MTVLMPIFIVFVVSHALIILYAIYSHAMGISGMVTATGVDIHSSVSELGFLGMVILVLKAYSMGAGTYTGIEAVSNGMIILREPRVKTAKATMTYMMVSLATVVFGLMLAYTLFQVHLEPGKTLNAVLFEKILGGFGPWGYFTILITLISEAAILFVAAQTGFLGGPRVLANMAGDRWVPKRFGLLSDRLVTMNGVLIMGGSAIVLMLATGGSVGFLVVLYAINVFITFCLAQAGMVRHWWQVRAENRQWLSKISINGIGLVMTSFILISMTIIKFNDGGWITLFITGSLIALMIVIRENYLQTRKLVRKLDVLVSHIEARPELLGLPHSVNPAATYDPTGRTAVIFVKDYTGIGIKTLHMIFRSFGSGFRNFIFVQLGLINAGTFRSEDDLKQVKDKVEGQIAHYLKLIKSFGYYAEGVTLYGTDTVEEASQAAFEIRKRFPDATFFGGQIIFPKANPFLRLLHNYTLFSMQRKLYEEGIPLFVVPIELTPELR